MKPTNCSSGQCSATARTDRSVTWRRERQRGEERLIKPPPNRQNSYVHLCDTNCGFIHSHFQDLHTGGVLLRERNKGKRQAGGYWRKSTKRAAWTAGPPSLSRPLTARNRSQINTEAERFQPLRLYTSIWVSIGAPAPSHPSSHSTLQQYVGDGVSSLKASSHSLSITHKMRCKEERRNGEKKQTSKNHFIRNVKESNVSP